MDNAHTKASKQASNAIIIIPSTIIIIPSTIINPLTPHTNTTILTSYTNTNTTNTPPLPLPLYQPNAHTPPPHLGFALAPPTISIIPSTIISTNTDLLY